MNSIITLNQENIVIGIKQVKPDYTLSDNEILFDIFDSSIVGKTYDPLTKTFSYTQDQINQQAKEWRDSELSNTDSLMLLSDYPYKEQLTAYRQALRDWPSTPEFPNTRPTLGKL